MLRFCFIYRVKSTDVVEKKTAPTKKHNAKPKPQSDQTPDDAVQKPKRKPLINVNSTQAKSNRKSSPKPTVNDTESEDDEEEENDEPSSSIISDEDD